MSFHNTPDHEQSQPQSRFDNVEPSADWKVQQVAEIRESLKLLPLKEGASCGCGRLTPIPSCDAHEHTSQEFERLGEMQFLQKLNSERLELLKTHIVDYADSYEAVNEKMFTASDTEMEVELKARVDDQMQQLLRNTLCLFQETDAVVCLEELGVRDNQYDALRMVLEDTAEAVFASQFKLHRIRRTVFNWEKTRLLSSLAKACLLDVPEQSSKPNYWGAEPILEPLNGSFNPVPASQGPSTSDKPPAVPNACHGCPQPFPSQSVFLAPTLMPAVAPSLRAVNTKNVDISTSKDCSPRPRDSDQEEKNIISSSSFFRSKTQAGTKRSAPSKRSAAAPAQSSAPAKSSARVPGISTVRFGTSGPPKPNKTAKVAEPGESASCACGLNTRCPQPISFLLPVYLHKTGDIRLPSVSCCQRHHG